MKHIDWFEHISATSRIVLLTLSCAGAFPSSTSAQTHAPEGFTKGFSVGGHIAVIGVDPGSFDPNHQAPDPARVTLTGGGLTVAYGLNEWLTLTLTGDGHESENDRHFAFADIGAQVFLPRGRRVRPHLDVALTGRRADLDAAGNPIDTRGAGVSVGGGALYFLSPSFAFDAALMWTPGDLHRYADGRRVRDLDAVGVSAMRFLVGVRWFAGDRR
jgi:Outer membrane protein beta-barrel domain